MSLTDLLKNVLSPAEAADGAGKNPLSDAVLLIESHEKASQAAQRSLELCESAGTTLTEQRASIDAGSDHARLLLSRGRDARNAAQAVQTALERAKLIALNAGLEGSRTADTTGKALLVISEELRSVLDRGVVALEDHMLALTQMDREREKLRDQLELARERGTALADELLQSRNLQRVAQEQLQQLGSTLNRVTGSDPEVGKLIASAENHARGLVEALTNLTAKPGRTKWLRALGPTLAPLLRLLGDQDAKSSQSDEAE